MTRITRLNRSFQSEEPPPPFPLEAEPGFRPQPPAPHDTDGQPIFDHISNAAPAADRPPPPYEPAAHGRCAVLPPRIADWRMKGNDNILLSTLAAAVLVSAGLIDGGNVELLQAVRDSESKIPTDPISSLAISTYSVVSEVLLGATEGPREAYRQIIKTQATDKAEREDLVGEESVSESAALSVTYGAASSFTCPTPSRSSESGTIRAQVDEGTSAPLKENPYAAVALSSGRGIARIVGAGLKTPGLYTYGLAQGFNNVPRIYGDDTVRAEEKIDGVSSGLVAAGKGLGYGLYDGISGFFVQPVKGAQKEGALGFLKGFGKGLGGIVCKPVAGACGVPGYAFMGVQKSIEKQFASRGTDEERMALTLVLQGEEEMRHLTKEDRLNIVRKWQILRAEYGQT